MSDSDYGAYGLGSCSEGGCASQIIEIVMSGVVMAWVFYEWVMLIGVLRRLQVGWQQFMLLLIVLSLSFNICLMTCANFVLWYILSSLVDRIYFTTIVFYFAKKILERRISSEQIKPYLLSLIAVYTLICAGQLGIFIYQVSLGLKHCKEIAELIIEGIMIGLAIVLFVMACYHQAKERTSFPVFEVNNRVNDPFFALWIWVTTNILGQILSEVENALIYAQYKGQECYLIQNDRQTQILAPVFMVLDLALPFAATTWFYRQRRKQIEHRKSMELELSMAQVDVENRIQLKKEANTEVVTTSLSQKLL